MSKNSFMYADVDSKNFTQCNINNVLNHNHKHRRSNYASVSCVHRSA